MIDLKIELSEGQKCSSDVVNLLANRCLDPGKISDGYHTFDELYDHRIALFIALCKSIYNSDKEYSNRQRNRGLVTNLHPEPSVWRSRKHSDGSSFEGWFVLGIFKEKGKQITYHLPESRWEDCDFTPTLESAPEWDGHTSADVLERLKRL